MVSLENVDICPLHLLNGNVCFSDLLCPSALTHSFAYNSFASFFFFFLVWVGPSRHLIPKSRTNETKKDGHWKILIRERIHCLEKSKGLNELY